VDGDTASLRLGPGDRLTAGLDGKAVTGGTAIVTIRPERIALREKADGNFEATDCPAPVVVRGALYGGPTSRFVVELDGGGELMVLRQNAQTSFEDAEA